MEQAAKYFIREARARKIQQIAETVCVAMACIIAVVVGAGMMG